MTMLHNAETVLRNNTPTHTATLDRVRVPGGWLYITTTASRSGALAVSQTFVPDPAPPA